MVSSTPEINIKDLVLEQPKQERPTVILSELGITETDLIKVKEWINLPSGSNVISLDKQIEMAVSAILIAPDRFSKTDLEANGLSQIKSFLKIELGSNPLHPDPKPNLNVLKYLYYLKIFDPEAFLECHVNQIQWQNLAKLLNRTALSGAGHISAPDGKYYALTSPIPKPPLTNEEEAYENMLNTYKLVKNRQEWVRMAELGADLKVLYPERAQELDLTEAAWDDLRNELDRWRKEGHWDLFIKLSSNLAFLAASKITSDDTGIHIEFNTIPQQFNDNSIQTPELRKF